MLNKSVLPPTDQEIKKICGIINETLGFNYTAQKKYLIENRLNKRLLQLGFDNYRSYLDLLQQDPEERNILCELLTTNVTSFFREPVQFEYLAGTVLPRFSAEKKGPKKIRCWSAGSSSGEEAYSIAITCHETLGQSWDIKVLATDVSVEQLKIGSLGSFPREKLASVPAHWRVKYFRPDKANPDHFCVVPELRRDVLFRAANLLDVNSLPSHIRMDIIFCRNVFIYLSKEARAQILNHFYFRLNDGGYLFLGHSESIDTASDQRWLSLGKSIYKKRQVS
ncbi:MAG TPA: protein-glutamate O-methyltransferase CheR [Firmicutes bacterium]|uniref:protein-glutamate O-methyltransferase n=1 Tax=Capillibacterium thermochitinicola TaxID=2699427 RepID=A0A8J6LSM8_9FIRM|nr:protein-glutamate O-methyltransferase CheR [Capillibacterium thermochitinicola]MBA2133337.1 protein-glutamate O-methyltransferase CheR [Capillibacterium thermochitinicola]HHW12237.1 protein-glutamate O-methyltransferase CheR [Bacillota bacterium]